MHNRSSLSMAAIFAAVLGGPGAAGDPWNPYPVRGPMQFDAATFGAKGDNSTVDSASIQRAISAAAAEYERSGGQFGAPAYVRVRPGGYLVGSLNLSSNVYLVLERGAVLQGSHDPSHYAYDWEQWNVVQGFNVSNTGLIGPEPDAPGGELRGSMWQMISGWDSVQHHFVQTTWKGVNGCDADCRPMNLLVVDSTNVTVANVRIADSAFWTQTFRRCTNVLERGVVVEGALQYGNNDGLDIESCTNVTVADSAFQTGDDCIALRSGHCQRLQYPWPLERGRFQPCRGIRLRNLTLTSTSAAIKAEALFQQNHGDLFDVEADGITIRRSNRGIGLWQRNGNGSFHSLLFRNIRSETQLAYQPNFWGSGEAIVVTSIPVSDAACAADPADCPDPAALGLRGIENVTFENIEARAEGGVLLATFAGPATPPIAGRGAVRGLTLRNVSLTIAALGNSTGRGGTHDFSPMSGVYGQQLVRAPVDGIFVDGAVGVGFDAVQVTFERGRRLPTWDWSMRCLNVTARTPARVGGRVGCQNETWPSNATGQ